jgi:CRP-like cAMP-binding protein
MEYSASQAAKKLGVSRNTLLRWFREGRLGPVERDRNWWRLFRDDDLLRIGRELERLPAARPIEESGKRMRSYLRRVPTFTQLPEAVLDSLAEVARFQGFLRGQLLFAPGEHTRGLYILVKGRVRIYRASLEGREQTLAVVTPYQTLGESVLFRHNQQHANHALCLESSTVIALPLPALRQLTAEYPQLATAFLREFSRRIEDLESRLEELALLSLEQRLARWLLEQAGSASEVEQVLSLAEMASYLGVARESLSRALLRFSNDGLVQRDGRRILIKDREALSKY